MSYTEENVSNFDNSCKFFEQEFTQEELYKLLADGNLQEKQLACIRLSHCDSIEEVQILMQNLTGIDGKVREAVSFKLKTFIPARKELFLREDFYNIFLDAIIDINGNICRNTLYALEFLVDSKDFSNYFIDKIIERALKVLETIENFEYKDRKYVTNKEVFKLYWYLETLNIFQELPTEKVLELLERSAKIEEYTIREKTARLLIKLPKEVREKFSSLNFDNNFYVNLALNPKQTSR